VYSYKYESESGGSSYYSESRGKTKTTDLGARIRPVLMYDFSDRVKLIAYSNLFNLGFSQQRYTRTHNFEGDEYTFIITGFDAKIDTKNVLSTIGFIYKF